MLILHVILQSSDKAEESQFVNHSRNHESIGACRLSLSTSRELAGSTRVAPPARLKQCSAVRSVILSHMPPNSCDMYIPYCRLEAEQVLMLSKSQSKNCLVSCTKPPATNSNQPRIWQAGSVTNRIHDKAECIVINRVISAEAFTQSCDYLIMPLAVCKHSVLWLTDCVGNSAHACTHS